MHSNRHTLVSVVGTVVMVVATVVLAAWFPEPVPQSAPAVVAGLSAGR